MLSRDQILSAHDLYLEEVEVPEWSGTVFVRRFSAGERDRLEAAHQSDPNKDIRARFVVACCCDAEGNLLFTADDIPALSAKSAAALDHIFTAAVRINAVSTADVETLKKLIDSPLQRFILRLAVVLGKTDEEIERLDSWRLSRWMAYDQLYPLPDPFWIGALGAWTTARYSGQGNNRTKLEDFLPRAKRRQSLSEMKAILKGMVKVPPK